MRRIDLIATVVVIALAAWAVTAQFGGGGEEGGVPPRVEVPAIEIGTAAPTDVALRDLDGKAHRLGDRFGEKATILYSWSTTCPCIPWCEDELQDIFARYGPKQGIEWVAIAGEPTETNEGVRQTLEKLQAPYGLLLDPTHRLCRPLGFDRAAIMIVLDPEGVVRFWGNPSDRLKDPTRWFLNEVLEDVAQGRTPEARETELTYGCNFSKALPPEADPTPQPAPASAPPDAPPGGTE